MNKRMTAAELLASLNKDSEFVERRESREKAILQTQLDLKAAEAPLLEALRSAGVEIASVWDLVNGVSSYTTVLPLLLDHLHKAYPPAIREGIARALATPSASFGWRTLVELYRTEKEERVKDGLAIALSGTVTDATIDELITLIRDRSYGASRLLLLHGLKQFKTQQAHKAMLDLASDPVLSKEISAIFSGKS